VTQAQILGFAEVLKTSNCRCKNVNGFVVKTEPQVQTISQDSLKQD